MSVTDQQILDAARAALLRMMEGDAMVSYSVGNRTFTRANLREFDEFVRRLEAKINAQAGGLTRQVTQVFD